MFTFLVKWLVLSRRFQMDTDDICKRETEDLWIYFDKEIGNPGFLWWRVVACTRFRRRSMMLGRQMVGSIPSKNDLHNLAFKLSDLLRRVLIK